MVAISGRRQEKGARNVGFSAKVQRNLALDFVTKQHESLQEL